MGLGGAAFHFLTAEETHKRPRRQIRRDVKGSLSPQNREEFT